MNKNLKLIFVFAFVFLFVISFGSAYTKSYPDIMQYVATGGVGAFAQNSLAFDKSMCETGTDFLLQIVPFSCEPNPIRSDLLEEEDVAVYCQIAATQINPLIDVETIKSMKIVPDRSFGGGVVKNIAYYPSQAALGRIPSGVVNNPMLENLGYVVIIVGKNANESAMPDFVEGNLTATLRYDIQGAFGIGKSEFYLPVLSDSEFQDRYLQYGFWDGRGYLRAEGVGDHEARISIYSDAEVTTGFPSRSEGRDYSQLRYSSYTVERGKESPEIYLPGLSPCMAGFKLRLNDVENPDTTARLRVNSEVVEVKQGEKFLEDKCTVLSVEHQGLHQSAEIRCIDDDGRGYTSLLSRSPGVELEFDKDKDGHLDKLEFQLGDKIYSDRNKDVFLGYVGSFDNSLAEKDMFVVLFAAPSERGIVKLDDTQLRAVARFVKHRTKDLGTGAAFVDNFVNSLSALSAVSVEGVTWLVKGEDFEILIKRGDGERFKSREIELNGFSSSGGSDYFSALDLNSNSRGYYDNAIEDFETVEDFYSEVSAADGSFDSLGEQALYEALVLASRVGETENLLTFCDEFIEYYPNSLVMPRVNLLCYDEYTISNTGDNIFEVLINGDLKEISLERVRNPTYEQYGAEIYIRGPNGKVELVKLGKDEIFFLDGFRGQVDYDSQENIPEDEEEVSSFEDIETPGLKLKIKDSKNVMYKYYKGAWYMRVWRKGLIQDHDDTIPGENFIKLETFDSGLSKVSLENRDKRIIDDLKDKDYAEGMKMLVDIVLGEDGASLGLESFSDMTHLKSDGRYVNTQGNSRDVDFRFDKSTEKWYWGSDASVLGRASWIDVSESGGDQEKFLNEDGEKNKATVLRNMGLYEGTAFLFWHDSSYNENTDDNFDYDIRVSDTGKIELGFNPESIALEDLGDDRATINFQRVENFVERNFVTDNKQLTLNKEISIGDYYVTLKDIHLEKVARVTVVPMVNNQFSNSTFPYRVAIEKRKFPMSDERINEKIETLDGRIEWLNTTAEYLETTVEIGNKVCTGVGLGLTLKNLINNMNGGSIARTSVMQGKGGWNEVCQKAMAAKEPEYSSLDDCFLEHSKEIDNDVKMYTDILKSQNDALARCEGEVKGDDGNFAERSYINQQQLVDCYLENRINDPNSGLGDTLDQLESKGYVGPDGKFYAKLAEDGVTPLGVGVDISEIDEVLSKKVDDENYAFKKNVYSVEQLKEIEYYSLALQEDPANDMARERLYSSLTDLEKNARNFNQISEVANRANIDIDKVGYTYTGDLKQQRENIYLGLTKGTYNQARNIPNVENGEPIYVSGSNHGSFMVVLADTEDSGDGSKMAVKRDDDGPLIYDLEGERIFRQKGDDNNEGTAIINAVENTVYVKRDAASYRNPYTNPRVKYFDNELTGGYPAVVPVDTVNGWYAATKSTLPVGGNIAAFDKSGVVRSFWLCNVGENGLEEYISGDDICSMINLGTGDDYTAFHNLDPSKVENLIRQATRNIEEAQSANKNSRGWVTIDRKRYQVGQPQAEIPSVQCQDLMSPKDCSLMYNFCDPFVCPSSRCDLGGKYPVRDVVQSGIFGGVVLCYPNAKWHGGDVYVPICVSAISAGVDGWLQVNKGYRDCLQHNLDTGETVGICDEMHSIYLCDFFYRQAKPILQLGITELGSALLGQNSRGGGEYMTFKNAISNAGDSIDYFKQYYAAEAYRAFKLRSVDQISINDPCGTFQSVIFPNSGEVLDSLTQARSPVQFTGKFEEMQLTTITNPPTSHYKVYYQIYAGKDSGAYYQVYLRGGSGSDYYRDTTFDRIVDSGHIAAGQSVFNTEDFQAPSGYKELCVVVNGQQECGFQQVSTSFGINYLSDLYMNQQASETDIKTEKECISGSSSMYQLLNPNLQSAAENIIDPAVYNNGLYRKCATHDPGAGVDSKAGTEDARWVKVGYCGDTSIGCWIDTDSVKDVIKHLGLEEDALNKTSENFLDELFEDGNYLSDDEFNDVLLSVDDAEEGEAKLRILTNILERIFWNNQKAIVHFKRGEVFASMVNAEKCPYYCWGEQKGAQANEYVDGKLYYGIYRPNSDKCSRSDEIAEDCEKGCHDPDGYGQGDPAICLNDVPLSVEDVKDLENKDSSEFEFNSGGINPFRTYCYAFVAGEGWFWINKKCGFAVIGEEDSEWKSVGEAGEAKGVHYDVTYSLNGKGYWGGLVTLMNGLKSGKTGRNAKITAMESKTEITHGSVGDSAIVTFKFVAPKVAGERFFSNEDSNFYSSSTNGWTYFFGHKELDNGRSFYSGVEWGEFAAGTGLSLQYFDFANWFFTKNNKEGILILIGDLPVDYEASEIDINEEGVKDYCSILMGECKNSLDCMGPIFEKIVTPDCEDLGEICCVDGVPPGMDVFGYCGMLDGECLGSSECVGPVYEGIATPDCEDVGGVCCVSIASIPGEDPVSGECSDCKSGFWDICAEEECLEIEQKTGRDCVFAKNTFGIGGVCSEKGEEPQEEVDAPTECSDCKDNYFEKCTQEECSEIGMQLNKNCVYKRALGIFGNCVEEELKVIVCPEDLDSDEIEPGDKVICDVVPAEEAEDVSDSAKFIIPSGIDPGEIVWYEIPDVRGDEYNRDAIVFEIPDIIEVGTEIEAEIVEIAEVKEFEDDFIGLPCGEMGAFGQCISIDSERDPLGLNSCEGNVRKLDCPGGSNIRCCILDSQFVGDPCGLDGTCLDRNFLGTSCDGDWQTGLCGGTSAIQCCVPESLPPDPNPDENLEKKIVCNDFSDGDGWTLERGCDIKVPDANDLENKIICPVPPVRVYEQINCKVPDESEEKPFWCNIIGSSNNPSEADCYVHGGENLGPTTNVRVLEEVEQQDGEIVPGTTFATYEEGGVLAKKNAHCATAIYNLLGEAGCGTSGAVYGVPSGDNFNIYRGSILSVLVGSGDGWRCTTSARSSNKVYGVVLNELVPGQYLDVVFDTNNAGETICHTLIFMGWEDRDNYRAVIFDWIGGNLNLGTGGCTSDDAEGGVCHTYGYEIVSLRESAISGETNYPIYRVMRPVVDDQFT